MQQARIIAARRFFSICVILMLIFSLIPAMPASAEVLDFETAIANIEDGGTIDLQGQSYIIGTQSGNELDPYIFKKNVTITDTIGGGNLTVWKSGLLLEADVTFKDMKLTLANSNRNAVFANGYTLTMENVTGGSREINLFAGNAYAIQSDLTTQPLSENSGNNSKIILRGTNSNFGNIYGGSMNGNFDYDVELNISGSFNGDVYACGAIQSTVDDNKWFDTTYQPERPDIRYYRFLVTGDVNIKLSNSSVTNIDGLADSTFGSSKYAIVEYHHQYETSNLSMKNIGGLSVLSGGALKPASMNSGIPVSVAEGATLNLSTVAASGENSGMFSLGDFYGGGTVVLGKDQTLNIFGNVSGTTKLAIDSHLFPKDARDDGHVYISAPASADGAFHLLPSATQTGKDFVRNDKGEWSVPSQTSGIDISGANIEITDDPNTLICVPGGVVEPDIEVYLDGERLGSEYYEVSYDWNDLPGEAYVVIQGKNGYTGTAEQLFNILPADVTDTKYTQAAYTVLAKGETKTVTLPALPHAEMKYGTPRDGNGNMTLTDLKVEASAYGDGKYQLSFTAPSGNAGQSGRIIVPVEVKDPVGTNEGWSECCPYRNYELTATITSVGEAVVPYPPGGNSGGGGGGGGGASPAVQKPIIEAAEGVNVTLSTDGTAATITVAEGYELVDVTVNDISKGAVTAVSGLKTGDKLVVKAAQKDGSELTKEEQKKVDTITGFKPTTKLTLTKLKNGKKAIRITWNKSKYQFDGVEIWRSMKKNSGYGKKPIKTIKSKSTKYYYNTAIKKGKTYYYKLRGYVEVNGKKYYTSFSKKVYRTVK